MIQVTPLSQRNSNWSSIKLGYGEGTIGNYGCLLTAITAGVNSKGANLTPAHANEILKKNNGFTDYGTKNLIIWAALTRSFSQIKSNGIPIPYDNAKAVQMINAGIPVIVMVDGSPIGASQHWVLYIGDRKMMDPWTGKIEDTGKYTPLKLVEWELQQISEQPMEDYYLGIDLNNKESVKVCVQTWKDVIDGKYIKKEDHERTLQEQDNKHKEELSKKDGKIEELQQYKNDNPNWESKYNTLELNAELRLKAELEKAELDCQTELKEQQNNNLLEHEKELNLLRDKIEELENREPTKIIYRETPLEERFAEKTLSEKVIAILEIISARKK